MTSQSTTRSRSRAQPVARTAQDLGSAAPTRDTGHHDEYRHLAPRLAEFAAMRPDDPRRRPLRDELAAAFWPLVEHIARRYRDRGEPLADLEQTGAVGLLGALERFDPGRGIDFLGFAVPTITGEIRRHFRDRTWAVRVPRRLKDLQVPVRDTIDSLSISLGRAPRPSEIAAQLGVGVEQVVDALVAAQAYAAESVDVRAGRPDDGLTLGERLGDTDDALDTAETRGELRAALAELPDRERRIVVLRFFGDLTQTQIAARVGVSQMHVSRLLSASLSTLRLRIGAP